MSVQAGRLGPGTTPRRRRRIWPWLVTPLAVLALLVAITWFAHEAQSPDLRDPATMSPTGTGRDGASRLAEMLRAKGVTIRTATSSQQATQMMISTQATVFVPAPDLLSPAFAALAPTLPGRHRIVLVQPGASASFWGLDYAGGRWAAGPARPLCGRDFAEAAGTATMAHARYEAAAPTMDCYDHGLVGLRVDGTEIIAAGASDPFRDGRIDERGNAALALGLLADAPTLIWVDVHAKEPFPKGTIVLPRYKQPQRGGGQGDGNPIYAAMPAGLWGSIALLVGLAVLIAFVRARRLGPPVREPLPVLVPATEDVTGRGRLYARARAHEATLEALRSATIRRIAVVLGPPGTTAASRPPSEAELVEQVATRTGRPAAVVREVLYGASPTSDAELTHAVAALDSLEHSVLREQPRTVDPRGVGSSIEEEQP